MPLHWVRHKSRQIIRFWRQKGYARLLPLLSAIRVGGLLAAALALWGFALIADEVLENQTQKIDSAILLALLSLHTPLLDRVMRVITFVGEPSFLLVICLIVASWLLWSRHRSAATTLAIACIGAIGLNFLLKNLFARTRPMLWQRSVDVSFYSFPSGHAMVSLVIYGMLSYLLATRFHRKSKSILSVTILLIAAIGLSRLYLGVHWPTDVIAGYAAGLVWLIACIFSLEVWRQRRLIRNLSEEN
ncbi:MAG TPA: phosphatidic acid phosphatase [Cyanobacteria bacterium UBA11369]|nr:phosphatidic acid phosphatase [Cyanobacteria bacterium UBA11371]HBE53082.1 phosphatidic acid phosphatase [Cyanobacteria bacterium UBA11369]